MWAGTTESACKYHTHQRGRLACHIRFLLVGDESFSAYIAMAGFQEQDHFKFYSQAAARKTCEPVNVVLKPLRVIFIASIVILYDVVAFATSYSDT